MAKSSDCGSVSCMVSRISFVIQSPLLACLCVLSLLTFRINVPIYLMVLLGLKFFKCFFFSVNFEVIKDIPFLVQ